MNLGDWGAGCNGPNVWGPRSRMWNPPTPLTISGWSCGGEGTRWRPGTRIRVLRVKRDVGLPVCRAGTRWEAGRRQPAAGAPPGRGLRPWTPGLPRGPQAGSAVPGARAAEQGTRESHRATRLSGEWAARGAARERATPPADGRSARSGRQVHALVVLSPRGEGRAGQRGGRGGGGEDEATRRGRLRVRTAWVLNRVHFKNSAAPVNLITAATIWRFVDVLFCSEIQIARTCVAAQWAPPAWGPSLPGPRGGSGVAGLTRPGRPETAASLPGPFPENSRGRRLWGRRGTQTRVRQASSRALKADGDVGGDSLHTGAEAPQHDGVPAAARTSGARFASVPLRLRAGSARLCPESRRAPCRSRALDGAVWASGAGARPRPAVSCARTRGGLGGAA